MGSLDKKLVSNISKVRLHYVIYYNHIVGCQDLNSTLACGGNFSLVPAYLANTPPMGPGKLQHFYLFLTLRFKYLYRKADL